MLKLKTLTHLLSTVTWLCQLIRGNYQYTTNWTWQVVISFFIVLYDNNSTGNEDHYSKQKRRSLNQGKGSIWKVRKHWNTHIWQFCYSPVLHFRQLKSVESAPFETMARLLCDWVIAYTNISIKDKLSLAANSMKGLACTYHNLANQCCELRNHVIFPQ